MHNYQILLQKKDCESGLKNLHIDCKRNQNIFFITSFPKCKKIFLINYVLLIKIYFSFSKKYSAKDTSFNYPLAAY